MNKFIERGEIHKKHGEKKRQTGFDGQAGLKVSLVRLDLDLLLTGI